MKRLWIFDFDGTLVDSEVAIRKCYLQVTAELIPERLDYVKNINQKNYEEIFLVGDTVGDAIAAKNHQIKFIKAVYGYGKQQNWENISIYKSIDSFNELKTFL